MIYRMMMLTILSGIWTSVFSLLVLILVSTTCFPFVIKLIEDCTKVAASPTTLWYCVFEFPISPLYISTLLANLNSRAFVRGENGINWGTDLGGISSHNTTDRSRTLHLNSLTGNGLSGEAGISHRKVCLFVAHLFVICHDAKICRALVFQSMLQLRPRYVQTVI